MKAYLQYADGREETLDVKEPDPKDGSYCLFLPEHVSISQDEVADGEVWIRICPND